MLIINGLAKYLHNYFSHKTLITKDLTFAINKNGADFHKPAHIRAMKTQKKCFRLQRY